MNLHSEVQTELKGTDIYVQNDMDELAEKLKTKFDWEKKELEWDIKNLQEELADCKKDHATALSD